MVLASQAVARRLILLSVTGALLVSLVGLRKLNDGSPVDDAKSGFVGESYAIPSEWTEVERSLSPDGKVEAIVVTARPCVALRHEDPDGEERILTSEELKVPGHTITCLRIEPKGTVIENEPPYRFPIQTFPKRVKKSAIFVARDLETISVAWTDNMTLAVKAKARSCLQKLQEAEIRGLTEPRIVNLRYQLDVVTTL